MRHRHVVGIAAVAIDAERIGLQAHVLVAGETGLAFAAAEPRIDQRDVADLEIALVGGFDIGPERQHLADRLMAHRARQRHAAILERKRLSAVAEIVAAFPDVQIAVADAGGLDLDQHLRSRRLRRRLIHLLQGGVEIGDLETLHRFSPVDGLLLDRPEMRSRARPQKTCGSIAAALPPGYLARISAAAPPSICRKGRDLIFREAALPAGVDRVFAEGCRRAFRRRRWLRTSGTASSSP